MERDGLLTVTGSRTLALTGEGLRQATRVMRKHRLAECLLVDVIGLPWEEVHIEACRWEHVISDSVERRLVDLLRYPRTCPHGNVIPGLDELGVRDDPERAADQPGRAMTAVAGTEPVRVIVQRISEQLQSDAALMLKLKNIGIQPGREVTLVVGNDDVRVTSAGTGGDDRDAGMALSYDVAAHVFVLARP